MKHSWPRRIVIVSLTLALNACAVWTRIDTPAQEGPDGKYRVEAPVGWVRHAARGDAFVITRDGLAIQLIEISQRPAERAFARSKGKLADDALPADVAQLVLAELHAVKGLSHIVVKENVPTRLAGQPAFRLRVHFRNPRGVAFEQVVIGTVRQKELLTATYQALSTHYFARDLPAFERLVDTLKAG